MFFVEVELVFSHDEAAEEDQGGLQEEHQVRLEEGVELTSKLFLSLGEMYCCWFVMSGLPNTWGRRGETQGNAPAHKRI